MKQHHIPPAGPLADRPAMSRRRFLRLAGGGAALVLAGPAALGPRDAAAKQLREPVLTSTTTTVEPAPTYTATSATIRHRRHRREALDGESHLPEDSFELCERHCTASLHAHEYEGRS